MSNNSEISIDDLIKRIYKSYVEIKVGEFREIDRDLLLSDIGLLYTSIKNLYPSNEIPAIEFDLSQKAPSIEIENSKTKSDFKAESIDKNEDIREGIDDSKKNVSVEENQIPTKEEKTTVIDLSIFEDAEQLTTNETMDSNLVDRKSDNTSSPVLKGFQSEVKPTEQKLQDLQSVPKVVNLESEKESIKKVELKSNIEEVIENDKKSKSDIMDFLHHDDKKTTRDIYSFLDLNTRIGLIELFFKGNSMELTECLVWLNKLDTKEACMKVIDKFAVRFGVDKTEDIYKQFVGLVDRKLDYSK
ncbi:MAG: hypothetical protein JNL75_02795 [Chitinophagales bacterium]|nr:hypothetical protein [Chitinophagales bacterium]